MRSGRVTEDRYRYGRTALATLTAPEGDKSIVGIRLVLESGRSAWEFRIAVVLQQCVTAVLVDAESGELLSPGPESEQGR